MPDVPKPRTAEPVQISHYVAACIECDNMIVPFERTDEGALELIKWTRAHAETNKHEVLIPFKVYERVNR